MDKEQRVLKTPIFQDRPRYTDEVSTVASPLRVYLAHNFSASSFLKDQVVPALRERNVIVCSTWIYQEEANGNEQYWAIRCLEEVCRCDVFIIFAEQVGTVPGRGKYVEFGYALARNKPVIVIGDKLDCIFYHYPQIMKVATLKDALDILQLR